jgi:hypothetical protein
MILHLTKEYILSKITEEDIFRYYLQIDSFEEKVRSPFKYDSVASGSFYYTNDKLRFNDFTAFNGDCFDLVARLHNVENLKSSFMKVLHIIATDLNLLNVKTVDLNINKEFLLKEKAHFDFSLCEHNILDLQFFKRLNINKELLIKYRVYRLYNLFINDFPVYRYDKENLAFIFLIGKKQGEMVFQLYFPMRDKSKRYLNNVSSVKGLDLIEKDHIVITKSYKDLLVLKSLGVNVVCTANEYKILTLAEYEYIKTKIGDNLIFTLFDNDHAGKTFTIKHRKLYNTIPLLLKDTKDISDYILKYGKENTIKLIENFKNEYFKIK